MDDAGSRDLQIHRTNAMAKFDPTPTMTAAIASEMAATINP
jgi:hypothetical protein